MGLVCAAHPPLGCWCNWDTFKRYQGKLNYIWLCILRVRGSVKWFFDLIIMSARGACDGSKPGIEHTGIIALSSPSSTIKKKPLTQDKENFRNLISVGHNARTAQRWFVIRRDLPRRVNLAPKLYAHCSSHSYSRVAMRSPEVAHALWCHSHPITIFWPRITACSFFYCEASHLQTCATLHTQWSGKKLWISGSEALRFRTHLFILKSSLLCSRMWTLTSQHSPLNLPITSPILHLRFETMRDALADGRNNYSNSNSIYFNNTHTHTTSEQHAFVLGWNHTIRLSFL